MTNQCDFCDELNGGSENEFSRRYAGVVSKRSWWSSANFIAVPSLGQLSEGHTLVVPRQHVYSMGALGTDLLAELDSACDEIRAALTSAYVQPIWFEHGCVSER